jgi:ABC-type transport system involved in cytochrome c biogenesis permease subunit
VAVGYRDHGWYSYTFSFTSCAIDKNAQKGGRMKLRLCAAFVFICVAFACASESSDALAKTVVLDNGRQKPFDTYARTTLLMFSGRDHLKKEKATPWLTHLIFNPSPNDTDKIFLINNPEVADAIGIPAQRHGRYSYAHLYPGLATLEKLAQKAMAGADKLPSAFDSEVIRTWRKIQLYLQLSGMFSFLIPQAEFDISDSLVASCLHIQPSTIPASYLEMLARAPYLSAAVRALHNGLIDSLDSGNLQIITIARTMYAMGTRTGNPPIHLIPNSNADDEWLSPWGMVNSFRSAVINDSAFVMLTAARNAYLAGDQKTFDRALDAFGRDVRLKRNIINPDLEIAYNRITPVFRAKLFFGLALIVCLMYMAWPGRWLYIAGCITAVAGISILSYGLVARIIIMGRPPVTNLYETFVFVAWASAVLGLILEAIQKKAVGLLVTGVAGFLLLQLAARHGADGDTMGMLAAVLNSNFWLSSHIITIAMGYAGCMAAGIIAHVYLFRRVFLRYSSQDMQPIAQSVYAVLVFGFVFTIIGTILGGMWADRSWGRFWGWDPKENGALLIIIWCTILLHAHSGRMIRDTGMAAGAVIAMVLIVLAWIGVNLLGVGLHSYGFTSSGAKLIAAVCGFEGVFLFAVMLALHAGRISKIVYYWKPRK